MSARIPEAESYIDYRLRALAERNEHHQFEVIATRIARRRISANILVANGPVSAGGDQQRDAESYTTRIPDELPHSAGFAASASTSPVVLACTVQAAGLRAKVLADLDGICAASAAPVESIAFFSVHNISEGTTHELQRIARESYGVALDVYSGLKVSTLLAERDLIWVARHYLELPSALVPDFEDEQAPEWYLRVLENLRLNGGPAALTPATQGEVTDGLRHATWDPDTNADLPEWLDFMSAFLTDADDGEESELVFRACYEMSVARFRGMGVGAGVEDLMRRAIAFAQRSSHPNVLDDAVTLASYWGVMWRAGVGLASATEIASAVEGLRVHVVEELAATDQGTHPVRAASLTGTLAFTHLLPQWERLEEQYGQPIRQNVDPNAGMHADEFAIDTLQLLQDDIVDLDGAMEYLSALVDLLPEARPYSVRSLSRVFTLYAPALTEQPEYSKVRNGLDSALALVDGDAAIADQCRRRGMAFAAAGQPLEAIRELHDAKVRWFHGDSMYGSVMTMRYLGNLYRELGLTYAAKMYACCAAVLANQSNDSDTKAQVPLAFFEAAQAAQLAGCWIDGAGITEIALMAQNLFATDPFDMNEHPELEISEANEFLELSAVRAYWADLLTLFEEAHPRSGWFQHLTEMQGADPTPMTLTEDQFQELAYAQFYGPVLSDIGPQRSIDFRALGVRWVLTFDNDRITVLTAEGFCAGLQVLIADIARFHPVLINRTVRVTVHVPAGSTHAVDDVHIDDSGPEVVASVTLSPDVTDFDEVARSVVSASFPLVAEAHVRPPEDLQALLEPLMRDGLSHKVTVARPYQDAADLLDENHYSRCAAATRPRSSDGFVPVENEQLAPSTRTGPGYDRNEALELIRQRYEVAYEAWRYSIGKFLSDPRGRRSVEMLQADGWLDWQILVAIVNVGMNWRIGLAGLRIDAMTAQRAREIGTHPEDASGPHLPVELVLNEFELHMRMQTMTVARRWKLRPVNDDREGNSMRDLIVRRYHYAEDDLPHRPLLDAVGDDGALLSLV